MLIDVYPTAGSRALGSLEIGMFTLLVWAPVMAAGFKNAYQQKPTVVSAALTARDLPLPGRHRGDPVRADGARGRSRVQH